MFECAGGLAWEGGGLEGGGAGFERSAIVGVLKRRCGKVDHLVRVIVEGGCWYCRVFYASVASWDRRCLDGSCERGAIVEETKYILTCAEVMVVIL